MRGRVCRRTQHNGKLICECSRWVRNHFSLFGGAFPPLRCRKWLRVGLVPRVIMGHFPFCIELTENGTINYLMDGYRCRFCHDASLRFKLVFFSIFIGLNLSLK